MVAGDALNDLSTASAQLGYLAHYIEHQARSSLIGRTSLFNQTTDYVLSVPGKLLRPRLMLESCLAAGGDPARVYPAAAGTEYGHLASLIHDDIIDRDQERRGQQALHARYGIPAAILTGDFFIFQMFLSYCRCFDAGVSAERVLHAIRILGSTCIEVCRGQELEARLAGDISTTEEQYLDMVRLKTASVCRAAAELGALLGGAGENAVASLRSFGEHLGLAFQVIDDVLCYDGLRAQLGKPVESDLHNHRVTLPIIYALKSAKRTDRQRIVALIQSGAAAGNAGFDDLVGILAATHSLARARARAARFVDLAYHNLDRLPLSDARERLRSTATQVLQRDH
jgi:geranylgeranyl diphosphate synthase type I